MKIYKLVLNIFKNEKNLIFVIFLLAILTRLWNLKYSPGWFPDEGVNLNIAWNLLHGKAQLFSNTYPFLPHPPLFFILAIPQILIFGKSILAVRVVSALSSIFSAYLIFLLSKNIYKSSSLGFLTSLFYVFLPLEWGNARYGLSYETFLVFSLWAFYLLSRFAEEEGKKAERSATWAGFIAGLSAITSMLGGLTILVVWSVIFIRSRKNIFRVITSSLLPVLAYLIPIILTLPHEFLFDLKYLLTARTHPGGTSSPDGFIAYIGSVFGKNGFMLLGISGLFFLKGQYRKIIPWLFIVLAFLEFKIKGTLFFAYIFAPIGLTSLVSVTLESVRGMDAEKSRYAKIGLALMAMILFVLPSLNTIKAIAQRGYFGTSEETSYAPDNLADAKTAADFVNSQSTQDDLNLASPHFSSLLQSKTTDPILALTAEGYETTNFSAKFNERNRYIYNPSLNNVKFAVIDKFTRGWFAFQPNVSDQVLEKFWNYWPVAFETGEYTVLRNPNPIVPANEKAVIDQPYSTYPTMDLLSCLKFNLDITKVLIYKDLLSDSILQAIRSKYSVISETDSKLTVQTDKGQQKVFVTSKPIVAFSSNENAFYDLANKEGLNPRENLVLDISTMEESAVKNLSNILPLPNLLFINSDEDQMATAAALEQSNKQRISLQPMSSWSFGKYWQQVYNRDYLESPGAGILKSKFTLDKKGDYLIYARVLDSAGNKELLVSVDGESHKSHVGPNDKVGFHWKQIADGTFGKGEHSLGLDNSSGSTITVDEIYVVDKNIFKQEFSKAKGLLASNTNAKRGSDLSSLDLGGGNINAEFSQKKYSSSVHYSSSTPTVVALAQPFSSYLRATDQDGKQYSPVKINSQYLGFIIDKTGDITLEVD